MATYLWSVDDNIPFDPVNDLFRFDDATFSAADVTVEEVGADLLFSYNGKTVTLLNTSMRALAGSNVQFDDLSWLVVGDNDPGVTGDDTPNSMMGTAGDDQLIGLGGGDTLDGGLGEDLVYGGDGEDQILWTAGDGFDQIDGGDATDILQVYGTSGDDVINVVTDGFTIVGLGGGTSNVFSVEMANLDVQQGGADTLDYTGTFVDVIVTLDSAATGFGSILGTSLANVTGGDGFDVLTGDAGANIINGGAGDDDITGAGGDDALFGLGGDDVFVYAIGDGQDTVDGGNGDESFGDLLVVGGTATTHYYWLQPVDTQLGINIQEGNADEPTLLNSEILASGVEEIQIETGDGGDTVIIAGDLDDVGVAPFTVSVLGGADDDTLDASGLTDDEGFGPIGVILDGVEGNDVLRGGGGDDELYGGPGDDELHSNGGFDFIDADTGDDTIYYTSFFATSFFGPDVIDGCEDTDTLYVLGTLSDDYILIETDDLGDIFAVDLGDVIDVEHFHLVANQGGIDTLSYVLNFSFAPVTVNLAALTATGFDTISAGIENVEGGDGADSLTGDGNANDFDGNGGDDLIHGGGGNDVIEGCFGDDLVFGEGGDDVFEYYLAGGGDGEDMVTGGELEETHGDTVTAYGDHSGPDLMRIAPFGGQLGFELDGDDDYAEMRAVEVEHVYVQTGDGGDTVFVSGDLGAVGVATSSVVIEGGIDADTFDASGVIGSPAVSVTLVGFGGNDTLKGGAGTDKLQGDDGLDQLDGGAGNDHLYGGGDGDTIAGGADLDYLYGEGGEDALDGGTGTDYLYGGAGGDQLTGGTGVDYVRYDASSIGVTIDLQADTASGGEAAGDALDGIEGIYGSQGNDDLDGDDQPNTVYGFGGEDTISGRNNNDILRGGDANDALDGGAQIDYLYGDGGDDALDGGADTDYLSGGAGGDELSGGTGLDYARYDGSSVAVTIDLQADTASGGEADGDELDSIEGIYGSQGADHIDGDDQPNTLHGFGGEDTLSGRNSNDILKGGDANDTLDGGAQIDYLYGENGDDALDGGADTDYLSGGAGADDLSGGTGLDYARYDGSSVAVTIDLQANTASGGEAAGDTFDGIEGVYGSQGNDHIDGDGFANTLVGYGGEDTLSGRDGNDTLKGGDARDTLDGGVGDDVLYGDNGNDVLLGGAWSDRLYGGIGADELNGGTSFDYACYDLSSIAVTIDLQFNTASGGEATGDTLLSIEGVLGSSAGDHLYGNGFANSLQGKGGADYLEGRGGGDNLLGGAGNDTFRLVRLEAHGDMLYDFDGNGAGAGDQLEFSGYGAGSFEHHAGNQWRINSQDGLTHDIITFVNGHIPDASDWSFI